MKLFGVIIVTIAILIGGFLLVSKPSTDSDGQQLTFASVQADVKNGAKFYDVRTPEEFSRGHFAGAVNISLQQMQDGMLPKVSKDTDIYVHCQSGNRSAQAAALLRKAGFTNVTDLGGITDVEAIGGTVNKS